MAYIVQGYLFLTAFYWISFKDNKDFNNMLIKSIALSYVLKLAFDLICTRYHIVFTSDTKKNLVLIMSSIVLGLVLGKIIIHPYFNRVLHKLHVGRTTNTNIWDDVIEPYTWVRVFLKDGNSYLGQYRFGEPFKSEPIIVLSTYQKLDVTAKVIIDNSQNPNELIMVSTKDFDRIEITHTSEPKRLRIKAQITKFKSFIAKKLSQKKKTKLDNSPIKEISTPDHSKTDQLKSLDNKSAQRLLEKFDMQKEKSKEIK